MNRSIPTLLATAVAAGAALFGSAPHTVAHAAATLPIDRLHFGASSGPGHVAWMTASGGWHYRYQYLAGGVNTPGDWQTWQDPAKPPGQYVLDYANESAGAGIVPVLTYYELLQSTPSTGSDESTRDWNNLHNTATMKAYYADFTVLMRRLGQYGGPAIVHVEPDLWGYLQQRSGGTPANLMSAVVGSSGVADVAGISDSVAGFADALLHLRDRYAPNVSMAIHASMWGSGVDVASDTRSSLDGGAIGRATGTFLNSAGITSNPYGSTWDVVFHDVDANDAGWWEAQGSDNAWFTHWWDASNSRFPNFTRWLAWVSGLSATTNRPQVAWQVPIGNEVYLTMNNTCGHYQDNIAQYVFGHPTQVAAAGIAAVLFGAGNGCQTTNEDSQHDGVTNNGGRPTSDIAGGCNACNTATSTVSDDDGGYLRAAVPAYEAAGAVPVIGGCRGLQLAGDFTGDGIADVASVNPSSTCVSASSGSSLARPQVWSTIPFYGSRATLSADVNGDGRADLIAVNDVGTWVMASTGSAFGSPQSWSSARFFGSRATLVGDINGDGRPDLVAVNNDGSWAMINSGSTFQAPVPVSNHPFYGSRGTFLADVNGDGRADLVAVNDGSVWVMLSTGNGFTAPQPWSSTPFFGGVTTLPVDVDHDGKADLVAVNPTSIWVMLSTGGGYRAPSQWSATPFYGDVATLAGDVTGDGRGDLIAVDTTSTWALVSLGNGFSTPQLWGS